ncbi:MAG: hypothetical protein R2756_13895 [Bacteroidales bacterium]
MAHTVGSDELRERDMTRDMPYLLALTPSVVETSDAGTGIGYVHCCAGALTPAALTSPLTVSPSTTPNHSRFSGVDLPGLASSTGSIQVQQGVSTSTNGAGAFGASVNISTEHLPAEAGAAADISYGSFSTSRLTAKSMDWNAG